MPYDNSIKVDVKYLHMISNGDKNILINTILPVCDIQRDWSFAEWTSQH